MRINDSILILYASQTGTAEDLAKDTEEQLVELGYIVRCLDCYDTNPTFLREHKTCILIASTWADGDPPDDAETFYNDLENNKNLDLSHLRFAVFGLGNSAYEQFNECGKNFDRMLKERGGSRILPRVDCDVDMDAPFDQWVKNLTKRLAIDIVGHC